ncbi:hypothetical protein LCGC14_0792330 [marine sediment metagenome]|uniref:HNH nuclease domain-containing protein n=1 Tax=marine sediment metagenome TaxID=412755 RepID=A0A0F9SZB5_9ZZZZ
MPIISGLEITEKDIKRIFSKVIKDVNPQGCWGWSDILSKDDYAYISIGGRKGKKLLAHRVLYELFIGVISTDMDLDHLCRNRFCVRPEHQEPVTRQTNLLRGETLAALHASTTHCPQGHPYDIFNTRITSDGRRVCKICNNIIHPRERRAKCLHC